MAAHSPNSTASLVKKLQNDDTLLKITAFTAHGRPCFYIQKTLLASASEKLVSGLCEISGLLYIRFTSYDILKTFLGWILSRRVECVTQLSLVRAWIFGARYSIAPFQNNVMRRLVDILRSNPVDPSAVREAYYDMACIPPQPIQAKEVLKLLRQALVTQIAYQTSKRSEHTLDKDNFEKSRLMAVAEFQEDLTHAVCIGSYDEDPDIPGVQLDKHLVEE